jgi:hypothetical protein
MERRPKPFLLRGGSVVQCFSVSVFQWFSGSVVQWFSGSVVDNLIELIAAGFRWAGGASRLLLALGIAVWTLID